MHKDACACQRDRAVGLPLPLSEDPPRIRDCSPLAPAGMSDAIARAATFHPGAKPLKRDLDRSDANNNSRSRDANAVPAKYQVLPSWDCGPRNAMNGNLHLEAADARGVAMETHGRKCAGLLNEQMLEQLNGMSLTERRLPGLAPRITLTSVDGDDEGPRPDMMADAAAEFGLGPAPKFLTVPKLQEVGKERRPPPMVKTV